MVKFMNEGNIDRAVRFLLGIALLYIGWTGVIGGTFGWVLKIGGFLPLITGLVGWCPAYALLGITTRGDATGGPITRRQAA
jgi:hypothetical protein